MHRCGKACGSFRTSLQSSIFRSCRRGPARSLRRTRGVALLALLFGADKERRDRVERPIELTAEGVWNEISGRLREALNENPFSTWFSEVRARSIPDADLVLTLPNTFPPE